MLKNHFVYLLLVAFGMFAITPSISAQEVPDEKWSKEKDDIDLPALFQDAANDINSSDFKAGAKKLKKYTSHNEGNGQAWFLYAYALHMDGQLDEAIPVHKRAAKFPNFKPTALYNLGCAYSLKKDSKKSLDYLHQALDAGFNQFDMFETDGDLENVKKADGFAKIKARAENNGKRMDDTADAKPAKGPKGAKALIGVWAVTSGTRQGEEIDAERLPPEITFTKKDLTIPTGGGEPFVMSYKVIKKEKGLIHVDFAIESGPAPDGEALGILKIKGNQAKLCYDPMGQTRPESFETDSENGFFSFVMEKQQKEKKTEAKADKKKEAKKDKSESDESKESDK